MAVLFLVYRSHLNLEIFVFLNVVFVRLISRDQDNVLVLATERNLSADWVPSWVYEGLTSDTSLLINLPDVDGLLRFSTQSDQ